MILINQLVFILNHNQEYHLKNKEIHINNIKKINHKLDIIEIIHILIYNQ